MQGPPDANGKVKWTLLYNSDKHGKSFNRFLYHVTWTGPCLSTSTTISLKFSKLSFETTEEMFLEDFVLRI